MNINKIDRLQCTGCAECVNVCLQECIQMIPDKEGFYFPKIQEGNCINCGLCFQKCPTIKNVSCNYPKDIYAVQRKDSDKLKKSASGGVAAIFSEQAIQNQGVVYGCIYDSELRVKHTRIISKYNLEKLFGSKYVQSDFSEVYRYLKQDCESGKEVVVIGTPCQIAGVRNFLDREYENVLLIDLICHGVPSPKLFKQYLEWKENKIGERIVSYKFRDKSFWNWGTTYKASISTATSIATATATRDPYYSAFIYAETYRESCYKCSYANCQRCGDISIGDFWGFEVQHSESDINWEDGVSVVLINTERGKREFKKISSQLYFEASSIDKAKEKNNNLHDFAVRPEVREEFYKNIDMYGFKWANKQMLLGKRYYIDYIKTIIPQPIKNEIKRYVYNYRNNRDKKI